MRLPLIDQLLRRLRGSSKADLAAWEEKHRRTIRADLERILPHLPEAPVYIDVGANIGLFSEELLNRRPEAHGALFEPVAEAFQRCQERFAGDARVRVFNHALSDRSGEATIYKARYNPGGNSLVEGLMFDKRECSQVAENPDHESEQVRLEVFDAWAEAQGIEHVDLIKTDCEGHDHAVLRGMLGFLRRSSSLPVLFVELMSPDYHTDADQQAALLEELFELGYGRIDLTGMDIVQDFVLLPEQR